VGFSNFFLPLSCLLRRPKGAVTPFFARVSQAGREEGERGGRREMETTSFRRDLIQRRRRFVSRGGIGTVKAGDRLSFRLRFPFRTLLDISFSLDVSLSATINRAFTFRVVKRVSGMPSNELEVQAKFHLAPAYKCHLGKTRNIRCTIILDLIRCAPGKCKSSAT